MTAKAHRFVGALALVAATACSTRNTQLDSNSGGDAARDQAMAVFVDRTVTDRLDAPGGDHTDWKYIDVQDPGGLRIEVSVDTPEKTENGVIELTDAFGSRLDRQLVVPGQSNYVFKREVEQTPDKYYVRVFTEKGGSVYTVGVRLAYAPTARVPEPEPVARVEPDPEPEPAPRKRKRTRTRRVTATAPPPPPPPPVVDPEPAAQVFGKVVRIIPAKDDSHVFLTVMVPSGVKVANGRSVTVYQGGSPTSTKGTVTGVSGRRVTVRYDQPPGLATGLTKVKF